MLSSLVIIFAVLLGIDEIFRQWVDENMNLGENRELFGGRIIVRKVYNRGFMLNLLDRKPVIVKGMTVIASIGILLYDVQIFLKKGKLIRKLGLTLASAGAAGNAFDRLARGKVIDYIGIPARNKFLGRITANLGDLYIACGGILLLVSGLFKKR